MAEKTKILIADDNVDSVELLTKRLRAEGYHTSEAYDGEQALRQVEEYKPDLIILDIMMPKIDGYEVCRRLKNSEDTRLIPIIMLTVKREIPDKVKGLDIGADGYISKPFDYRELLAKVKSLLVLRMYITEREKLKQQMYHTQRLASLGKLGAGVAHELNNPLSNISSSTQILLEELEESDLGFKKRHLAQIEEQTYKASNIVRTLLEFSGEGEFKKESLNLKALIEETISLIRDQIPPKIELVVDVADEIRISADKQRIQQAFLNLITNAVQAMEEKGTVAISAKVNREKDTIDIKFQDTGPEIKPDILPKVFDPFFTTKDVGKGSGLGLFITHQIIERHGGYITVESRLGEGTTFLVRLPA